MIKQNTKHEYIKKLDEDILIAHHKYVNEVEHTVHEAIAIYYELEEKKLICKFSVFLTELGIFTHERSFASQAKRNLFKSKPKLNHQTFLRYKKIIAAYEEYQNND